MTNNKSTKRALSASIISMALCVVLLIGTTFAWFTDSVTSGTNVIKAGNLDISATVHDLVDWTVPSGGLPEGDLPFPVGSQVIQSDNSFKLGFMSTGETVKSFENNSDFMSDSLFEPGKTHVKLIRVKNDGDLAAKIKLNFDVQDGGLQDALWFAIDGPEIGTVTRTPMSDLNNSIRNIEQEILPDDTLDILFFYGMNEDAGNEFKDKTFTAKMQILATQATVESDSFGTDYDANAEYPYIDNSDGTFSKDGKLYVKAADDFIEVTPYGGVDGLYTDSDGDAYVATKEAVTAVIKRSYDLTNGYENAKLTLVKDITIAPHQSQNHDGYIFMNDSELDLNGKTLTVETNNQFMVVGNNVTVKNGTIKAGSDNIAYPVAATAGSQNVVFENIVCVGGIQVLGNSTVTLKNVTSTATRYYNIYVAGGNATATIESGTFTDNGKAHFFIQDQNCKVIVKGGEFSGETPKHIGDGTLTYNR